MTQEALPTLVLSKISPATDLSPCICISLTSPPMRIFLNCISHCNKGNTKSLMVLNGHFIHKQKDKRNNHLTPLAIWKPPTNHHWVVAWLLLDANCPVLLTRGGIPRKGLTAQWLQQFASSTEVTTLFAIHLIPARRNFLLLCSPLWALRGTSWHRLLLRPSRAQMTLSRHYGGCPHTSLQDNAG